MQEMDDPAATEFEDVHTNLPRRFGPTDLMEVHKQALQQLKLGRNSEYSGVW